MALLEVKNLGISFGGLRAVDELDMSIEQGSLVGLIGPNGAGKTTAFNLLTGVYTPSEGIIMLDGENLVGKTATEICKAGIARTFQNIRLFSKMTVLDNVKTALHNHVEYSLAESFFHLGAYHKKEKAMDEKAIEILKVFDLDGQADVLASNLPYGKQSLIIGLIAFITVGNVAPPMPAIPASRMICTSSSGDKPDGSVWGSRA